MHRPRQDPVDRAKDRVRIVDMAESAPLKRLYDEGRRLLHPEDEDA
jgi:hypothetical protein